MEPKTAYSIVTPIYDEEGNIPLLYERVRQVMDSTGELWEFIMINDGSRDQSLALMTELAAKTRDQGDQLCAQLRPSDRRDRRHGLSLRAMPLSCWMPTYRIHPKSMLDMIANAGKRVTKSSMLSVSERKARSWFKLLTPSCSIG
jgi:hypothetical protein